MRSSQLAGRIFVVRRLVSKSLNRAQKSDNPKKTRENFLLKRKPWVLAGGRNLSKKSLPRIFTARAFSQEFLALGRPAGFFFNFQFYFFLQNRVLARFREAPRGGQKSRQKAGKKQANAGKACMYV